MAISMLIAISPEGDSRSTLGEPAGNVTSDDHVGESDRLAFTDPPVGDGQPPDGLEQRIDRQGERDPQPAFESTVVPKA